MMKAGLVKIRKKIYHHWNIINGKFNFWKVKNAKMVYGLNVTEQRSEKIIVSLASYKERYHCVCLTLKSLLLQSKKADKIIVWLDKKSEENMITDEMKQLEKYGVVYRYTDDDLKPHKKYFYAMQEFPNDCIITVDDDLIYSSDLIESLMRYHKKYPDAICARRVHKIIFGTGKQILPYKKWEFEYRNETSPSYLLCATGGAGTLYPPHSLYKEAFCIEKIKKYCLEADDIWLKMMELKNHRQVVWVKNRYVMPFIIENSQSTALSRANVAEGNNDLYIKYLFEVYPELNDFLFHSK